MKFVIGFTLLLITVLLLTAADAQRFPSIGPGSLEPIGPSSQSGGAAPPPPVCSNKLDFSVQCNSQYIGLF